MIQQGNRPNLDPNSIIENRYTPRQPRVSDAPEFPSPLVSLMDKRRKNAKEPRISVSLRTVSASKAPLGTLTA